jgi:acetyl esterase/lipase
MAQWRVPFSPCRARSLLFICISLLTTSAALAQMPGGGVGRGPNPLPAGIKAERDIPYVANGHRNQVLDLFLPEQPSGKPLPLMIWIHGDNNQLVPLGQSVILAKTLIDAGVEVTMKTIPGAGHEGPQFRTPESRRLMEEFLSRTLKK